MGITIKKYIWVLGLVAVVMFSYLLAKITTLFIAGQFPDVMITAGKSGAADVVGSDQIAIKVDIDAIIKRNFFDSQETEEGPAIVTPISPDTPIDDSGNKTSSDVAVKTALDIQLISAVSVGNGMNGMSSAVIQSKKDSDTYTIHDALPFAPDGKIVKVLPRRVEFTNKGRLEYVELNDYAKDLAMNTKPDHAGLNVNKKLVKDETTETAEIQVEGDTITIPRSVVNKALADLGRLATEALAFPYYIDGKPRGFKFKSVKRGSLFDKLQIRRGDIVKSINGQNLEMATGFQMLAGLKNESNFVLEMERRGEEKTFKYQIVD